DVARRRNEAGRERIADGVKGRDRTVERGQPGVGELIKSVPIRPLIELKIGREKINPAAGADHRLVVQTIGETYSGGEQPEVFRLEALLRMLRSIYEIDSSINRLAIHQNSLR